MTDEHLFDMKKELAELTNQLSVSRKIGFFLGAGVSSALGIPGIQQLTDEVLKSVNQTKNEALKKIKVKETIEKLMGGLTPNIPGNHVTIEDLLNELRLIRMLTRESKEKIYENISGDLAKELDKEVCKNIFEVITSKEKGVDISTMKGFVSWLNWLSRDFPKEIFTTNYDLILERALEELKIAHFDGFIGGHKAFFHPESVEGKNHKESLPLSWLRLWKLHGSFGWYWSKESNGHRIIRTNASIDEMEKEGISELVIYPSREKYESSRKQPFITFFDRFNNYLQDGECLFVISGYSFSDQHVNQVIFNSLKQNNRLHVVAFLFNDEPIKIIKNDVVLHMNFTAYAPNEVIVGGRLGKWQTPPADEEGEKNKVITKTGDFKTLAKFLIENSTRKNQIEESLK